MTQSHRQLPVLGAAPESEPSRPMTPLQAEFLEDGVLPERDQLGGALHRPDLAPQAGYLDGGPAPLDGPHGSRTDRTWSGDPPVFQWEIDPADPALESGDAHVLLDEWEYSIWWQRHSEGLLYASLQALHRDEAGGPERAHPLGRNVVVNLVYDEHRQGIVAIYGTARDFRPFVEAFRSATGTGQDPEETGT